MTPNLATEPAALRSCWPPLPWNVRPPLFAPSTYEELKVKYYCPCCHRKLSLRHPCHGLSATLRSFSEQPFDLTMQYHKHRESPCVTVNVTRSSIPFIESDGDEKKRILGQNMTLSQAAFGQN